MWRSQTHRPSHADLTSGWGAKVQTLVPGPALPHTSWGTVDRMSSSYQVWASPFMKWYGHTYPIKELGGSMTHLEGSIKCQAQCTHEGTVIHICSTRIVFIKPNAVIPLSRDHWSNIHRYPDTSQELRYNCLSIFPSWSDPPNSSLPARSLGRCTRWREPRHLPPNEATGSSAHRVFFQASLTSFVTVSAFSEEKQTKTQAVGPLTLAKGNI